MLVFTLPVVILEMEQVAEAHKCKHLPEQRQPWPGLSSSAQLSLTDVKYACALHNVTDISIFSTAKLQSHAWEEGAAAHYCWGLISLILVLHCAEGIGCTSGPAGLCGLRWGCSLPNMSRAVKQQSNINLKVCDLQ